jgi:hypothetical protein
MMPITPGHEPGGGGRLLKSPWPLLLAGVSAVTLGTFLSRMTSVPGSAVALLLGGGLLGTAGAVVLRPRSAPVLGLAAVACSVTSWGMPADWDSLQLFLAVLTFVTAAAAVLVLLPRAVGQAVVSLLILFHFGGIVTAVTAVPPPGGQPPWLVHQVWTRLYRPYLQFLYLNNAYHFYSPDPGPACLLWSRVEYADGSSRWVNVPNREEHAKDPMALEYYRRLSLTESTNQLLPPGPVPPQVAQRRLLAGPLWGLPTPDEIVLEIPGVPQYRVPSDYSQRLLRCYAAFLARAYPPADPAVSVRGVKVYRVVHGMISPGQLARGMSPLDPTLYLPYYQGEFDPQGNLKDPNDPLLYWLIPILKSDRAGEVFNGVAVHAESKPGGGDQ